VYSPTIQEKRLTKIILLLTTNIPGVRRGNFSYKKY
jgi:hypothetical protein